MPAHILIVEDDPATSRMVAMALKSSGYRTTAARSFRQAKVAMGEQPFDLLLCDLYLGDGTSIDLLKETSSERGHPPVIVFTAHGSVETAVEAIDQGAFDYLAKPFSIEDLLRLVSRALSVTTPTDDDIDASPFGERTLLIGNSPPMVELYKKIALAARSESSVLITGETGTGKELVARSLHLFSRRKEGPFVPVNCGALTESLLESELFGHERGAFTGAAAARPGLFQLAENGTLFLDEITETSAGFQVKLLRALQEKEIRPVGGTTPIATNARIVAASNRDLGEDLVNGIFRKDLFYRLGVVTLEIPPLRNRTGDIPQLIQFFLEKASNGQGRRYSITAEAVALLERHSWPGNVRELENAIFRSVALKTSPNLDVDDFVFLLNGSKKITLGLNELESNERDTILEAIRASQGNRSEAARRLGIGRRSLYRKADRLGIDLDEMA